MNQQYKQRNRQTDNFLFICEENEKTQDHHINKIYSLVIDLHGSLPHFT